ncbi:MAG: PilC/PilY family type IV pilus protein [Pseudomonadota bacterium]
MKRHRILIPLIAAGLPLAAQALNIAQYPLFTATTEPRILLALSKDHQLSIKAYTDYSDLNEDGTLDTTYKDDLDYYGYFDSDKCYTYDSGNSRFSPSIAVDSVGANHQCTGTDTWSGNFLNWMSMTRMDVLRKVFYGGYRSTDTTSQTILERHFLPVDVHSFVKVYNPGSATTLKHYIPDTLVGTNTAMSFCNTSNSTDEDKTGLSSFTTPPPIFKATGGSYPQWASIEVTQCTTGVTDTPSAASTSTFTVRVEVCVDDKLEDNCKGYYDPATPGTVIYKPKGLLQDYGDVDADRPVRWGLITGSYSKNKSGGVLRKNTTYLTNNSRNDTSTTAVCGNNHSSDEINVCTGVFINQDDDDGGIINTLNRLRIAGFKYGSLGGNAKHQYECNSPGIPSSFTDGKCVDWGSPMSEIYLEALRYFANAGPSTDFNTSDAAILSSLPQLTWSDPLPDGEWCAISSIVVLSTGLNSFDTDQLTAFSAGGSEISASALTQTVGDSTHENINGGTYFVGEVIGGSGSDVNLQCTGKTLSSLANARGICPQVPSTLGGYGIAGLAYAPKKYDLRPTYADRREDRWGGDSPINSAWAARQPINTYAVQLAETLPSFALPVGVNTVTILPACMANSTGTAPAWTPTATGWRNCSMTDLIVETNVAKAEVGTDASAKTKTCAGNGTTSGCFSIPWEDSTWGNDYDMDGIARIGYCVGSACSDFKMLCTSNGSNVNTIGEWSGVSDNEIVIAACTVYAKAGHALTFGYTVTGTQGSDGVYLPILRKGGVDVTLTGTLSNDITQPSNTPTVVSTYTSPGPATAKFTAGSSTAKLLENPLWYAAKYGGFIDRDNDTLPDNAAGGADSEWDADEDGTPDNYYDVRNPTNLITAMAEIIDAATEPDASAASVATNSTNLQIESRIYQAKFSSADWSGQLLQYRIETDGTLGASSEWDAGTIINNLDYNTHRTIITKGATTGVPFRWDNLTLSQQGLLNLSAAGTNDGQGENRVNFLRGSHANEGKTSDDFREREASVLGDIINSSPWFVGPPNAGYSDVDHPGYSSFRTAYEDRKSVVYVGGNDGMLHGFDASLSFVDDEGDPVEEGTPTSDAGKEILGYVPSGIIANLSRLTDLRYANNHRYFVDGSPMVADVDLDSTSSNDWRTVLVGGMAAGGKGIFALDITAPNSFSEVHADDILLWEFTDSDDADMGQAYNHPPARLSNNQAKQIVKMANGKWAAILGNGYNSADGKAVLYILFLEEGADGWTYDTTSDSDYVRIVVDSAGDNGLSTPVPFDSNGDGYADVVYAGDLKGNMWKFLVGPNASDDTEDEEDQVNDNPTTWKVAFSDEGCGATSSCNPLFVAKDGETTPNRQAIVWPPEVTLHPDGGLMVLFGTGKFIEALDVSATAMQTFYGIWDRHDGLTRVGTRSGSPVSDGNVQNGLLQQTFSELVIDDITYRTSSDNPTDFPMADMYRKSYCNDADSESADTPPCEGRYMGWYHDLCTTVSTTEGDGETTTCEQMGERTTGVPKLISGVIFFNSYIPSTESCDQGGSGWLLAVDYFSGGAVDLSLFDTDRSGTIGDGDVGVAGMQIGAALGGTTLIQSSGGGVGVGVSSLSSGKLDTELINFGSATSGRINWREIPNPEDD